MHVVRYAPWTPPRRVQTGVNRPHDRNGAPAAFDGIGVAGRWAPAVDIREEADRYVIEAEVAGVDPAEIEVTMERGVLSIKGERRPPAANGSRGPLRSERPHGAFHRRFTLPESVDAGAITAAGRRGVLEIAIPKHEAVRTRRIRVN